MQLPEFPPLGSGDGYEDNSFLKALQAIACTRFANWNDKQIREKFETLLDPNCADPRREDVQLALGALVCMQNGEVPDEDQLQSFAECLDIEVIVGYRNGHLFFEYRHRS